MMLSRSALVCSLILLCSTTFSQSIRLCPIPGSDVSFEMVLVPGGTFSVGTGENSKQVKVDSFWMGRYEVSYEEFALFYHRELDSDTTLHPLGNYRVDAVTRPTPQYMDYTFGMGRNGHPAVSMTQQAALRYCEWLYRKTGVFFRLPTEAEWEYACKLGRTDSLAEGRLQDHAWYSDNSGNKYHQTGARQPNLLGLYDLLGNVAEWTLDDYRDDYTKALAGAPADNPWLVPTRKHSRTVKGGSYLSAAQDCTCSARQRSNPRWQARDPQIPKSRWWNTDSPFVGFRLVSQVVQPSEQEVKAFFEKAIVD
ncbi:MAG: sulfatase-modifying factor [Saprospirales bacterium]|nr:sulfatase-modifying factor [Saprospirales bacterium]